MPTPISPSTLRRPMALVAAASFGLAGAVTFSNVIAPHQEPVGVPQAEAQLLDPSQPFAISDVAERVLPSVVSVTTRTTHSAPQGRDGGNLPDMFRYFDPFFDGAPGGKRESTGQGSGVIVEATKGLLVTNHHVVGGADSIVVTLQDGSKHNAELVGSDPTTDVAVLRLKPEGKKPALTAVALGDSKTLRLGEVVLAVGNPFGYSGSVTMGIVSAKGRAETGLTTYGNFIQTDAAVNPGNSGGALVNMRGELVGINTAILSKTGSYAGISFAIPTEIALPIMSSLVKNGRVARGYLGIVMQDLDNSALAESLGAKGVRGVIVADVAPNSPAEEGGLKPGDIIETIDGSLMDSLGRLRTEVALRPAGTTIAVDLLRNGKRKRLSVTLAEQPAELFASLETQKNVTPQEPEAQDLDGLMVVPLDRSSRKQFGIDDDLTGVVVGKVAPASMVARAGLRPGDIILELNRKSVASVEDFERRWAASKDSAMLRVKRGPGVLFIVVAK